MEKPTGMVRVHVKSGRTFLGTSPRSIVAQMRRDQWEAPSRKGPYMELVRDRVQQMTGSWIDVGTPESFLRSLEELGLITIEWAVQVH